MDAFSMNNQIESSTIFMNVGYPQRPLFPHPT